MRARLAPLFLLLAASWAAPAGAQTRDCSVVGQNVYVHDTMDEMYLWYRELPRLDVVAYPSPEALLDALRFRPLDDTFSYISLRAADDAFYSDSQFIGFGFSTKLLEGETLRVAQVFPDSPAADAGLERSHAITAVDGRTIGELIATGSLDGAFGPGEIGVVRTVRYRTLEGEEREGVMTKRLVTIPTVSLTRVFEVDGRRVGYLFFRNFVRPSVAALEAAFSALAAGGATELVLDLRYNGGGLVSVAQHLAGLVGGIRTAGQLFAEFAHNDKQAARNQRLDFPANPQALGLERLVVITTGASASASELIINALRPFLPVTVVGATTYGKPVGQYSFNFCEKVLHPVAFSLRNARGESDFFGGFPADCPAEDDLDHAIGDPAEASLAQALSFVATGTCGPASAEAARALRPPRDRQPHRSTGWHQVLGAY